MPYIGKSPTGSGVRTRYYFTATGGETSLSGADDGGKTLTFSDGEYVDVYLNGIALVAGTDYGTATANTISGLAALSGGDIVEVVVYDIYNVAKINSEAVRTRHYYTATGGETSIGTAQISGLSFPGGTEIEVSLNGISLVQGTDYNTTAANTVGGLSALSAGNVVAIVLYEKFQLADTVSKAQGGTFSGNVAITGALTATAGASSNAVSLQSSNLKLTDLTANAFYRAGTFVPAFSSTAATDQDATIFNTYTHQKGFYTRIGNLVLAQVDVQIAAISAFVNGGASGQPLTVVDFPFKFKNVTNQASSINVGFFKNWTTGWGTGYTPMGYGVINTTRVQMTYAAEAGSANNETTYINNSSARIVFDITYETDDA
jgi:hypothetical protein